MAKTILIIDDSEDDCLLLKHVLVQEKIANHIQSVGSFSEGVAYIEGHAPFSDRSQSPYPNIIFLDLKLPEIDGFHFLKWFKLHPRPKELLIVAISGFSDTAAIQYAYELGANYFVTKPFHAHDLESLIKAFPVFWEMHDSPGEHPSGRAKRESENRSVVR
jgi:CheY-like chemotaxis protein